MISFQTLDIKVCTALMHAKLGLLSTVRCDCLVSGSWWSWSSTGLKIPWTAAFIAYFTQQQQPLNEYTSPLYYFDLHSFSWQIIPLQCNLLYEELHKTFYL